MNDERFQTAIQALDAANAADPERVPDERGDPVPGEVLYARRMTAWLAKLYPDSPEALRLAARAQHVRRWEVPRHTFPADRIGYLKWRTTLYGHHADVADRVLRSVGYDDATIARVRSLLKKERIKSDPDGQALEDVICLVFLETEFADFAAKHDEAKVVNIVRRTWAKMSPVGQASALNLPLPPEAARLVQVALAGGGS
ncbi:MAG TPA: DUF4202 domain-containing protein [Tepidisphaeraceae bacterium]|nr:DUF4202 domain-containing protein [Tepidisphaeraceae bacterium]